MRGFLGDRPLGQQRGGCPNLIDAKHRPLVGAGGSPAETTLCEGVLESRPHLVERGIEGECVEIASYDDGSVWLMADGRQHACDLAAVVFAHFSMFRPEGRRPEVEPR